MNKLLLMLAVIAPWSAAQAATPAETQAVALKFAAVVGAQPFACGQTYAGMGTTQSQIVPSDFRFYVSDVALLDEQGQAVPVQLEQDGIWQFQNVALLDFEDGSGPCRNGNSGLRDVVVGQVPAGHYRGVRFTLGVPFNLNHSDPTIAPSPLNMTSLFWSWQSGYRFVKVDMASSGQPQSDVARKEITMADQVANMKRIDEMKKNGTPPKRPPAKAAGFSIHLGSTDCASASLTTAPQACRHPNRATLRFEHFDVASNVIVADLASLLVGTNVDVNAENSAPGCMSAQDDADCPGVMTGFGLPFGNQPAAAQRFFSVR